MTTFSQTSIKLFIKPIIWATIISLVVWTVGLTTFVQYAQANGGPSATTNGGPQDGMTGVPIDALIDRGFNGTLLPASITTFTVLLQTNTGNTQGGAATGDNLCTSVEATHTNTWVKCNHANLTVSVWYTFTITTGVTSSGGTPIAAEYTYSFQTGDFTGGDEFNPPPSVGSTVPAPGGSLASNGTISIRFSRSMRNATDGSEQGSVRDVSNIQLHLLDSNNAPTGSNLFTDATGWTWDATEMLVRITPPTLSSGSSYRVTVKGDSGSTSCYACVRSSDGLAMPGQGFFLDFTATTADSTAATVSGSYPDNAATSIDRALYDIAISFNESLLPSSISTTTVKLYCNDADTNATNGCSGTNYDVIDATDVEITGTSVTLDEDGRSLHLSPNAILGNDGSPTDNFLVRLVSGASGVKDIAGNALASDVIRRFSTSDNVNGSGASGYDATDPQVLFANADNYGIFITFNEAMKFDLTTSTSQTTSSGANDVNNLSNWTLETSADGTNYVYTSLTGKTVYYRPHTATLIINGLTMPPGQYFRVTGSTNIQDLSGNSLSSSALTASGSVQNSTTTGGMLGPGESSGPVNFFTMGVDPIGAMPKSALAGKTTDYRIRFRANQAIAASGKITLTYPSGFSFTSACDTWPTDTFENEDINGTGTGTVTVASISCDSVSRMVTITLSTVAIAADDEVRFEIAGVTNTTVPKDFSTSGYSVDIKTYNASSVMLESLTSMPIFISTPGDYSAAGTVFIDDGAGGGTANDGVQNGTESGVESVSVCLGGPAGFNCTTTDSSGDYSFTELGNGFYHLDIPPITSGSLTGGPFFRDVNVSGANVPGIDFGLRQAATQDILEVYVNGGTALAGEKIDIFAFSSMGAAPGAIAEGGAGGFVVREVTLDGSGVADQTQLPLTEGRWEVGLGPAMPKESGGSLSSMPDFSFMPPQPLQVEVGTSGVPDQCTSGNGATDNELCFTLTAATNQIKAKVVDGSGTAISNTFVMARPAYMGASATEAQSAGMAETDANGLVNIKVVPGTYLVGAHMPGMGGSTEIECTVIAESVTTDNNNTADVTCDGVLIENDISGYSGSSITLTSVTSNDLVLGVAKGDTSIAGRVLDDQNNAISYAHVEAMEVNSSGTPIGRWVDDMADDTGSYTVYIQGGTTATPKNWKVCAFAPGFGKLPCLTVAVTSGENLTDKNLQVTAADFVDVEGTIYIDANGDSVVDSGEGVSGAQVNVYGASGGNHAVTDPDGTYLVKVKSGTSYKIEGFVPGQGPTEILSSQDLSSDATAKNLKMASPGTIVVYVCTLTGAPGDTTPTASNNCGLNQVTDAFVDARDANGQGHGTASNTTSGQYKIVIPAGTYTVRAHNPEIGEIGSETSVAVTGDGTTYVNIAPPTTYTASGTVGSTDSACVEGVTVSLSDATNGRVIQTRANAAGAWSSDSVPNGTYKVSASKPGCVDSASMGEVVVTADVTESGDTDLARTITKTDVTVTGKVFIDANSDSSVDSGEQVTFDTKVVATSGTGKTVITSVDTSKSGTDNNYTLDLTAGTWNVQVKSDGYESATQAITVASADALTRDVELDTIAGYTRQEAQPFSMKPSRGGRVKNPDISDDFEVYVPAGALGTSSNDGSVLTKETTAVTDTDTQNVIGNKGIEVTPKTATGQPVSSLSSSAGGAPTITIPYSESDVTAAGGTEGNVMVAAWSEEKQAWDTLSATCDTTANKCTATIEHFSTFALIVAQTGALATPSGLAVSDSGSGTASLSWTTVTGAAQYYIYRSTDDSSYPYLGASATTSYSATSQPRGSVLYYKVASVTSGGAESAASSAVSITLASGGSGGGITSGAALPAATTTLALTAPNGGETLESGSSSNITWSTSGSGISTVRLTLSADGGLSFATTIAASESNDGTYAWTVPELIGSQFRVKIEGLDSAGSTVISDISDANFSIGPAGAVPAPTVEEPSAELPEGIADIPSVTTGPSFDKVLARSSSATINADLSISPVAEGVGVGCESGTLVKGESFTAVYYCGADGKRYVFSNEKTYFTWFEDFAAVVTISDDALAGLDLGGVVTYRPGLKMIKIESDPKVYAVAPGGLLRWITTEALATALYGADWNQQIDDVPVSFFVRYSSGPDITE